MKSLKLTYAAFGFVLLATLLMGCPSDNTQNSSETTTPDATEQEATPSQPQDAQADTLGTEE